MSEKNSNTTNNDILSGNGLKPLSSQPQSTQPSGLIIENKGMLQNGFRLDIFSKDDVKD